MIGSGRQEEDDPSIYVIYVIWKLWWLAQDDWKKLTLEEKKTLYRASFCQTLAEVGKITILPQAIRKKGRKTNVLPNHHHNQSFLRWSWLMTFSWFRLRLQVGTGSRSWGSSSSLLVLDSGGSYGARSFFYQYGRSTPVWRCMLGFIFVISVKAIEIKNANSCQ